jgi:2-polyprenyl-6-methoxyphenol hydroxylase-like FAD-dependent oxidoreductase
MTVLVVGGGIAGLTLAVALRLRGIDVDVVEMQPEWDILGVGLSLTGPTLRALKSVDLIDACVAQAFGFDRITFNDASGQEFHTLHLPKLCGPNYPATVAIGRPALHDVLLNAAQRLGVTVTLGTTIAGLDQDADTVRVTLSNNRQATYDLVVGCDGIRSLVRKLAFERIPETNFTGLAVWRAPMPRLEAVDCMQMFYGPRTKAGVNPHSRDEMFLFLVQPIIDEQRLVRDAALSILREQLSDFGGEVMKFVRGHVTHPELVDYRPMNSFLLPPPWYRGRVMVIGDAAHTTTPHLATGAGIAIEDAIVLAETLALGRTVPDALGQFMARRFDRCRLVVETAVKLGEMEKDTSIPIAAHFELMTATFRKLADPI